MTTSIAGLARAGPSPRGGRGGSDRPRRALLPLPGAGPHLSAALSFSLARCARIEPIEPESHILSLIGRATLRVESLELPQYQRFTSNRALRAPFCPFINGPTEPDFDPFRPPARMVPIAPGCRPADRIRTLESSDRNAGNGADRLAQAPKTATNPR